MDKSVERKCTFFFSPVLSFFKRNHVIMNFPGLRYSNLGGTNKARGQLNEVRWQAERKAGGFLEVAALRDLLSQPR